MRDTLKKHRYELHSAAAAGSEIHTLRTESRFAKTFSAGYRSFQPKDLLFAISDTRREPNTEAFITDGPFTETKEYVLFSRPKESPVVLVIPAGAGIDLPTRKTQA